MRCPHCGGVIGDGPKRLQHEVFDDATLSLRIAGETRHVSPTEWRILILLRERFGRCVRSGFIYSAAFPNGGTSAQLLHVYFVRLRRKIEGSPFAIANFRAEGYGLFPIEEIETLTYKNGRNRTQRLRQTRLARI